MVIGAQIKLDEAILFVISIALKWITMKKYIQKLGQTNYKQ